MHRGWWLFCAGWWILSSQHATLVRADTPPSPTSTTAAYDQWIDAAVQAYEAGRFAEARTSFRRAHELTPTARTLRTIGMCSFNLGDYPDAVWNLESARLDKRKPLTEEQQRHVAELIAQANQRIGRFRLRLAPEEIALIVDGRPAVMLSHTELLLEAGHHAVEARATGYQSAYSSLNVEGGDRTTLVFELVPEPRAVAANSPPAPSTRIAATDYELTTQPSASSAAGGGSSWRTLAYVSLGLGAAGLVGFGVVGGLALSEKGSLDKHCVGGHCASQYQDDVDRYRVLRTTSTVTLISGGALALLGLSLLIVQPGRPSAEQNSRVSLLRLLGPGGVGLRGELSL